MYRICYLSTAKVQKYHRKHVTHIQLLQTLGSLNKSYTAFTSISHNIETIVKVNNIYHFATVQHSAGKPGS